MAAAGGDEYREVTGPMMDPVENWVARNDSTPKFLDEILRAKSNKYHSEPCWLVVYLNMGGEFGIGQKKTKADIARVKARYTSSFEAISVLWKGSFY